MSHNRNQMMFIDHYEEMQTKVMEFKDLVKQIIIDTYIQGALYGEPNEDGKILIYDGIEMRNRAIKYAEERIKNLF